MCLTDWMPPVEVPSDERSPEEFPRDMFNEHYEIAYSKTLKTKQIETVNKFIVPQRTN